MILVPLILVCVFFILVGFIAGKKRGQSNDKMSKELFEIGKFSLLPILCFVAFALIFLFLILYHAGVIG